MMNTGLSFYFGNDTLSDKVELDFSLVLLLSLKTVLRFSFHGTVINFENISNIQAFFAQIAMQ